ncbi:MAG TPA: NAD(P)H-binding protein, partial [Gemmatimonadaceae bacterium]|nr:NAD(P)H-binding protein [Gemmatimonadaceae bacterium]
MKDVPVETVGGPTAQTTPGPAPAEATGKGLVLVTGAAGLVGSHTCGELARRGWAVRALVRSPTKAERRLAGLPVEIVLGDLRSSDTVRESVRGVD